MSILKPYQIKIQGEIVEIEYDFKQLKVSFEKGTEDVTELANKINHLFTKKEKPSKFKQLSLWQM
jgi:hypothetical protein